MRSLITLLFPFGRQVLENIRRQSCEGRALPFLFNWLLGGLYMMGSVVVECYHSRVILFTGDFTNLIGCILTHQLPFQVSIRYIDPR